MNLSSLLSFKPAPRTEVAKCFGVQLARHSAAIAPLN
jgi:hypothetical protein